ncbi:MAG: hypothetical protein IPI59_15910 [Sphingobacteriales bacterium]|nr:hypothetical protein [Sphingobacteriales bacterium]
MSLLLRIKLHFAHYPDKFTPSFFIRIKLRQPSSKLFPPDLLTKKQALKSPLFKTYNVNLPKLMSF